MDEPAEERDSPPPWSSGAPTHRHDAQLGHTWLAFEILWLPHRRSCLVDDHLHPCTQPQTTPETTRPRIGTRTITPASRAPNDRRSRRAGCSTRPKVPHQDPHRLPDRPTFERQGVRGERHAIGTSGRCRPRTRDETGIRGSARPRQDSARRGMCEGAHRSS